MTIAARAETRAASGATAATDAVAHLPGVPATPALAVAPGSAWAEADRRQLGRLLVAGFVLLLVPATLARLTGWRWQPWPPGPQGYGSIVGEARSAADAYVPLAFSGL